MRASVHGAVGRARRPSLSAPAGHSPALVALVALACTPRIETHAIELEAGPGDLIVVAAGDVEGRLLATWRLPASGGSASVDLERAQAMFVFRVPAAQLVGPDGLPSPDAAERIRVELAGQDQGCGCLAPPGADGWPQLSGQRCPLPGRFGFGERFDGGRLSEAAVARAGAGLRVVVDGDCACQPRPPEAPVAPQLCVAHPDADAARVLDQGRAGDGSLLLVLDEGLVWIDPDGTRRDSTTPVADSRVLAVGPVPDGRALVAIRDPDRGTAEAAWTLVDRTLERRALAPPVNLRPRTILALEPGATHIFGSTGETTLQNDDVPALARCEATAGDGLRCVEASLEPCPPDAEGSREDRLTAGVRLPDGRLLAGSGEGRWWQPGEDGVWRCRAEGLPRLQDADRLWEIDDVRRLASGRGARWFACVLATERGQILRVPVVLSATIADPGALRLAAVGDPGEDCAGFYPADDGGAFAVLTRHVWQLGADGRARLLEAPAGDQADAPLRGMGRPVTGVLDGSPRYAIGVDDSVHISGPDGRFRAVYGPDDYRPDSVEAIGALAPGRWLVFAGGGEVWWLESEPPGAGRCGARVRPAAIEGRPEGLRAQALVRTGVGDWVLIGTAGEGGASETGFWDLEGAPDCAPCRLRRRPARFEPTSLSVRAVAPLGPEDLVLAAGDALWQLGPSALLPLAPSWDDPETIATEQGPSTSKWTELTASAGLVWAAGPGRLARLRPRGRAPAEVEAWWTHRLAAGPFAELKRVSEPRPLALHAECPDRLQLLVMETVPELSGSGTDLVPRAWAFAPAGCETPGGPPSCVDHRLDLELGADVSGAFGPPGRVSWVFRSGVLPAASALRFATPFWLTAASADADGTLALGGPNGRAAVLRLHE